MLSYGLNPLGPPALCGALLYALKVLQVPSCSEDDGVGALAYIAKKHG